MWKRELIRNKIYAVLMVLASLPVVILEKDGTVLLLSLFFGVPMFFAKENWIMGGPVHESKESRKKSVRSRNVRCREKGYGHGDNSDSSQSTIESISERSTLWFCGSCVNSSASATSGLKNSMTTSPAVSRL